MFNILETLWNYFACKLVPHNLGSEVANNASSSSHIW